MTHQIGTLDVNYDLVNGQVMLPLRPNMKIQCGNDGKKENNCVITGGDIQVDGTSRFGISEDATLDNVEIQGVTFHNSSQYSVWLTRPGTVKFTDCEFRVSDVPCGIDVNRNKKVSPFRFLLFFQDNTLAIAPVFLDYYNPSNTAGELSVTFSGSTFDSNRYSGEPAQPSLVVGNGRQNRLIFDRNYFTNNNMKTELVRRVTNIILCVCPVPYIYISPHDSFIAEYNRFQNLQYLFGRDQRSIDHDE